MKQEKINWNITYILRGRVQFILVSGFAVLSDR